MIWPQLPSIKGLLGDAKPALEARWAAVAVRNAAVRAGQHGQSTVLLSPASRRDLSHSNIAGSVGYRLVICDTYLRTSFQVPFPDLR
jgi:hypothetical protein